MKKYIILSLCILLCGCSAQSDPPSKPEEITVNTSSASDTETTPSEAANENSVVFNGLTKASETPVFGNSLSCLNGGGLVFNDGTKFIYSSISGDLIMKTDNTETILLQAVFPTCINVCDDKIYFINGSEGSRVDRVDLSGENSKVYFDEPTLYFAVCESFFVYENEKNELYINRNGNAKLISDNKALWVDFYGNYIIYCELENNCNVIAYDTETGEKTTLLDYGFFPAVHGNELYYQEKNNGHICCLDLQTGEDREFLSHWGQNYCFINDELYFLTSQGIHSPETNVIYSDEAALIDKLFECGGELYFAEKSENQAASEFNLYKLDVSSGERVLIQ